MGLFDWHSPHLTCSDAFCFNREKPVPGFRLRSTSAGSTPARCKAEQGPTPTPIPPASLIHQGNKRSPALSCVPRKFIRIPGPKAYAQGSETIPAQQGWLPMGMVVFLPRAKLTHPPPLPCKCPESRASSPRKTSTPEVSKRVHCPRASSHSSDCLLCDLSQDGGPTSVRARVRHNAAVSAHP